MILIEAKQNFQVPNQKRFLSGQKRIVSDELATDLENRGWVTIVSKNAADSNFKKGTKAQKTI